ncbi:MAG: hypothetical protein B7Y59_12670 [Burkholderiales bacterium 35-55-47]|jgi:glycosyltransferase involved in cell wall biosynthesis|nr:MAG: hypothetical protein B7Y59_12670 [Burkholderiales bacterium 35-55-47]OZA98929.1 MAG: hypothetical protein B7X62_12655 [Burkholderiales bacterium 39-55-53]
MNDINKKKLFLIIATLGRGGAERVLIRIANYWAELGVDVTIVTIQGSNAEEYDLGNPNIKRITFNFINGSNFFTKTYSQVIRIFKLRKLIIARKPDAVLSFILKTNIYTVLASLGSGVHTVISERTDPRASPDEVIWKFGRKALYRYADAVVGQTPQVKDWLVAFTSSKAYEIPNYINSGFIAKSNLSSSVIVATGRLVHEKGFDLLLYAFSIVVKKHPSWRLVILGDGAERGSLQSLASSLNLEDSVQFQGYVSNPGKWMAEASIAVQPSRFEGFPNSLLESMAYGLAIIATIPAGYMMVENEVNGLIVPSDDVDTLSLAIIRLIKYPELRLKIGNQAAKDIRLNFNEKKVMSMWKSVLFPQG